MELIDDDDNDGNGVFVFKILNTHYVLRKKSSASDKSIRYSRNFSGSNQ